MSSQAQAELSLQQKLREDSELRLEEMEESLLEKEQELQKQQLLISRLQGEVLVPQYPQVLSLSPIIRPRPVSMPCLEGHGDIIQAVCLQVSGKLIDKEQILEEEIQLRERIQLQCKQAERMVEDLKMELHTTNQAKDELAKQVKVAQVRFLSYFPHAAQPCRCLTSE